MKRVCVFCGSSPGNRPEYLTAAAELGRTLAEQGIGLVYGGSAAGTMRAVASAALQAGGEVIGVMPRSLVDEQVALAELLDLRVVDGMHQRKALMTELADGLVALPGGLGTLDELFDVLSLAQLRLHAKGCALLNVGGYYDRLLGFLDHATAEGFIEPEHRAMLIVEESPARLLERLAVYQPPVISKAARVRASLLAG